MNNQEAIQMLVFQLAPVVISTCVFAFAMIANAWKVLSRFQKNVIVAIFVIAIIMAVTMTMVLTTMVQLILVPLAIQVILWTIPMSWIYQAWRDNGIPKWVRRSFMMLNPVLLVSTWVWMKYVKPASSGAITAA